MKNRVFALLALLPLCAAPLAAQGVAIVGRASTLGLGGEVSLGLGRALGLRAGINAQPADPSHKIEGVDYTLHLGSPSYTAMLDLYAGPIRLSGGLVKFGSEHKLTAEPTKDVEIGSQTYTPQQVGKLTGVFQTKDLAPYAGIGFGRLGGRHGVGLTFDLGVAYQDYPDVHLTVSGPIASQPGFEADLADEESKITHDVRAFRFYPVISLGLVIGI